MTAQQILTVAMALLGGTNEDTIKEALKSEGLNDKQSDLCLFAGKTAKEKAEWAAKMLSNSGL